eukprot:scaffold11119_cov107-Cylindrotheca_fusiformis.AAC.2
MTKRKKARTTKNDNQESWFVDGDHQLFSPDWKDGTLQVLKDYAEKIATDVIISQNFLDDEKDDEEDNDGKRRMSKTLPRYIRKNGPEKKAIADLWKVGDRVARAINRNWRTFGMVVLRSEAGCRKQATHEDGVPGQPEIGGLLIAVQEGTKLYVKGKLKELRVGDILGFGGSTAHCGADYSERNVRLHAYIAEKLEHIPINSVGKKKFQCAYCGQGFTSQKGLKGHISCRGGKPATINEEAVKRGNRERQQRFRDKQKLRKLLLEQSTNESNPTVEEN